MRESKNEHRTTKIEHPYQALVLVGPTASGKTSIALQIAEILNAEIISADSRQLYKYMDIGTAKPSKEDRHRVKHYFVDDRTPDREYNAGQFGKDARHVVETLLRKGKVPLIVGGSGLYIQALLDGFFEGPPADPALRKKFYDVLEREGSEKLLEGLRAVDPDSASRMLPTNTRRIIRALEVYHTVGIPISEMQKNNVKASFKFVIVGLDWERKNLYERINKRVDEMLVAGLLEEAKSLKQRGFGPSLNALQTVGYKEVFEHLDGKTSYDEMVDLIKRNSRRYAKRQLTWFRHDERIKWVTMSDDNYEIVGKNIILHYKMESIP